MDIAAIRRCAYGVLLPVLPELVIGEAEAEFLRGGGLSLLLAEVALDADSRQIAEQCARLSDELAHLGINLCLSPILDVVRARTPWLDHRNLGPDPAEVSRIGNAYIAGLQQNGRVAATAKHFPGHRNLPEDPALVETILSTPTDELDEDLDVFRSAIETGVKAIMTGPTIASALDPAESASTSAIVMGLLRERLGFRGLIVTDGLDEPSIARGRTVPDVAVVALNAGADLLLVPGGDSIRGIADRIVSAVGDGVLPEARLVQARGRVQALAHELSGAEH